MYTYLSQNNTITHLKTIAIHQPNYLPWLGYFYKIWASDMFVLHDNVEFTKQSCTKRVLIRKNPASLDTTYLSVPLKKHSDYTKIRDLEICQCHNWQIKHLNKIYNTYHKAPYFQDYFPLIESTILASKNQVYLKDVNEALIKCILKILNIQTLLFVSSELPIPTLKADRYNAEIVSYLGGHIYVSGQGATKYQSESIYSAKDIALTYNKLGYFLKEVPPQYPVPFLMHVSILDALFYLGKNGVCNIFEQYSHPAYEGFKHAYLEF